MLVLSCFTNVSPHTQQKSLFASSSSEFSSAELVEEYSTGTAGAFFGWPRPAGVGFLPVLHPAFDFLAEDARLVGFLVSTAPDSFASNFFSVLDSAAAAFLVLFAAEVDCSAQRVLNVASSVEIADLRVRRPLVVSFRGPAFGNGKTSSSVLSRLCCSSISIVVADSKFHHFR